MKAGKNNSEIADIIGVHKYTIGRELNRNKGKLGLHVGNYVSPLAQDRTEKRHKAKRKSVKLPRELKDLVAGWLRKERALN